MKFLDRLKLSLHNMWTSKSRTILTILIVFVVSTLIQVVGVTCINLASNLNTVMSKQLEESGSSYSISYDYNDGVYSNTGISYDGFKVDTVNAIYNVIKDDPTTGATKYYDYNNNSTISLGSSYSSNLQCNDFRMPMTSINMVEGRGWNTADSGTNAMFIDKNVLDRYNKDNQTKYSIGDTLSVELRISNKADKNSQSVNYNADFIIKGIFATNDINNNNQNPIAFDASYIMSEFGASFSRVEISNPDINSKNTLPIIITYNKTVKAVNAVLPVGDSNGKYTASNTFIEDSMMVIVMDIAIIGVGLVIGFIVLLLSIGSIANTMIISIDKNKKFTGLMMAMGLKPKSIKSVIRLEGAMTIIAGVLLSTILCLAFIPVFSSVLSSIFGSMFYFDIAFKFTFPFYFPIGVAVVFILMAMFFTRAGVRGLVKQDPITVISEVG